MDMVLGRACASLLAECLTFCVVQSSGAAGETASDTVSCMGSMRGVRSRTVRRGKAGWGPTFSLPLARCVLSLSSSDSDGSKSLSLGNSIDCSSVESNEAGFYLSFQLESFTSTYSSKNVEFLANEGRSSAAQGFIHGDGKS